MKNVCMAIVFISASIQAQNWTSNSNDLNTLASVNYSEKTMTNSNLPEDKSLKSAKSQVSIFPESTTGIVFISENIKTVSVYNLAGQQIKKEAKGTNHLDLSPLANGIYILKGIDQNDLPFEIEIKRK